MSLAFDTTAQTTPSQAISAKTVAFSAKAEDPLTDPWIAECMSIFVRLSREAQAEAYAKLVRLVELGPDDPS